ncbi:MAG: chemotaxis protein CheX [Magnetococcales bacterium]|nr:chemotaxis protein CheX [Magnetococcales bacterium]
MNNQETDISKRLLECMHASVTDTLSTMAFLEAKLINTQTMDTFTCTSQVAGLIYLHGNHEGMIALTGDRSDIVQIVSKVIALPAEKMLDDDIMDGVSELINMIAGGMKSKAGLSSQANLAPPISVMGTPSLTQWKTSSPTNIFTFQTEVGKFQVYASV